MTNLQIKLLDRIPFLAVNAIVLHGSPPQKCDFMPMYGIMRDLAIRLASNITTVDISTKSDGPGAGNMDFDEADHYITRNGFAQDTIRVTLSCLVRFTNAPLVVCSFGISDRGFSLAFDRSLMPFDKAQLNNIASSIENIYAVRYGYAVELPRRLSSWHYSTGSVFSRADYGEERALRKRLWNRYCFSSAEPNWVIFRDIYHLNFLSKDHFSLKIQGSYIGNWISERSWRGTLERIGHAIWAWAVPRDSISKLRYIFEKENLLIELPYSESNPD